MADVNGTAQIAAFVARTRYEDLPDDVMAQVIRSLGQDYSTSQDAALLRRIYPKLRGERAKTIRVQPPRRTPARGARRDRDGGATFHRAVAWNLRSRARRWW